MNRRNIVAPFILLALISLVFIGLSQTPLGRGVGSLLESIMTPIQKTVYGIIGNTAFVSSEEAKLLAQNQALTKKVVDQKNLLRENQALRDQFQTDTPVHTALLPVHIIGASRVLPGIGIPTQIIIDQGSDTGLVAGLAVVYKDNLVGKISAVSAKRAVVLLLTNPSLTFTAKTSDTDATGVLRGVPDTTVLFDNVLLSDKLSMDDTVMTKGDVDAKGAGIPPNLIVGRIVSIDKKASDLFQRAQVKSLVDVNALSTVFVLRSL